MKKTMYPVIAFVLGVAGFGFRAWQLRAGFDAAGLPVYGVATMSLIGFTVGALLLFAALCRMQKWSRSDLGGLLKGAGKPRGALQGAAVFYLMAILGIARHMLDGDLLVMAPMTSMEMVVPVLLGVGCAVSAAGAVLMPISDGKSGFGGAAAPALMCANGCLWLIECYQKHGNDPVTVNYMWMVLAALCAMLGWRYVCAAAYSKPRNGAIMFFAMCTVFFSVISLAEGGELYQQAILLGQTWWFGWYSVMLAEAKACN